MTENARLIVDTFKPSEDCLKFAIEYADAYGKETLDMFFRLKIIEKILLEEKQKPHLFIQIVKNFLFSISSKDPNKFHYEIARLSLAAMSEEKQDNTAIDLLARSLLEKCNELEKNIIIPDVFEDLKKLAKEKDPDKDAAVSYYLDFIDCPAANDDFEKQFFKENRLSIWDDKLLTLLSITGSEGRKRSKEFSNILKKTDGGWDRNFWFKTQGASDGEYFFHSPAIIILGCVLWRDVVEKRLKRQSNGYPSLVKPFFERLIPILGPSKTKKFIEKEGQIICCSQKGEPLIMAPAIDVNMISAFQKGVRELGTLTGHKMLRWQVNTGFERWQNGDKDPRLIVIDGGYSKIAELIKCSSKADIAKIKEILYAQAFGSFIYPDGSLGNMLALRIEDRHRNNEPSKIHIVLGDVLLPAYVCQFQGSRRRLIPIGPLPPLQGSPNTHASQAQLQLHVFSEFSNQSDRLAETGSVLITMDMWQKMAHEAGLNPEKVKDVIMYWCQPDLFNCFLEKQDDEYKLASYYDRAQKFLESQGQGRIDNSKRGKRSVEKRMRKSKKK